MLNAASPKAAAPAAISVGSNEQPEEGGEKGARKASAESESAISEKISAAASGLRSPKNGRDSTAGRDDRLDADLLIPPLNFGRVCRGVYRSGFPGRKNFSFLQKLGLKSVLNLSEHSYSAEMEEFLSENGISHQHISMDGNREPFWTTDEKMVGEALMQVLQATAERPILVHCTKGTHRTACVVGCLRRLEEWSLTSIFDEYRRFAGEKVHLLDQQFIEFFTPTAEHRAMARKTSGQR